MSLEYQNAVKDLAFKYGPENLVVMLGFLDMDLIEIQAITMTDGDPSGVGSLSGVALRLKVYHILEPEIKSQIPQDVYQEQIGLMAITAGPEKIAKISELLQQLRTTR
ncbi:MAG: hypothetical protein HYV47_01425 [Candidatus Nealsonbacteria bacterium]|nr:hypothetical protein [Candidatus Nealsonbacteria bacterium]